jgi:uncharacterized protein (TIGR02646 family)
MRYVNPRDVELSLPDDWADLVKKARAYLERAVEKARRKAVTDGMSGDAIDDAVRKARAKAINAKSDIWATAGKGLRDVMYGKCWYCETFETRSDMPVDHFRPKNRVVECDGTNDGYWWLAFDWRNYRYSCTYCNSRRSGDDTTGGKQDHFPLLNPKKRARNESELKNEKPELLDPCNLRDPWNLTFLEDGRAIGIVAGSDRLARRRTKTSIGIYHLNETRLKNERKKIALLIRDKVERIKEIDRQQRKSDADNRTVDDALRDILVLLKSSTPFCTAARCYLERYRHLPWVAHILIRS